MEDLMKWVSSSKGRSVRICLYDQVFRLSHLVENNEVWIDVDPDDESLVERVSTPKELAYKIRSHVIMSPLFDEMIMFDIRNAVWKVLRTQELSK